MSTIKIVALILNISIWLVDVRYLDIGYSISAINEETRSLQFRCRRRGGGIVLVVPKESEERLDKCLGKKRWCTRDRETDKTMGCLEIPILRAHDKRRSWATASHEAGCEHCIHSHCIQRFPGATVGTQFACRTADKDRSSEEAPRHVPETWMNLNLFRYILDSSI